MDDPNDGLLLIEGDLADGAKVVEALTRPGQPRVEWVQSLAEGVQRLERPGIAAILLNLFLPDSEGIETFDKALAAAEAVPILVLCAADNERIGRQAVERGADDFLLTDHYDTYSLTRAAKSMLERRTVGKELAEITLNSIGDAVLSTDVAGNVTYLNTVAECLTGWSRIEAAGRPLADVFNIIDATTRTPPESPLLLALRQNKTVSVARTAS